MLCFGGVVGEKNVAQDAVGVGFVHRFLIEMRLEQLHLLRAKGDGAVDEGERIGLLRHSSSICAASKSRITVTPGVSPNIC